MDHKRKRYTKPTMYLIKPDDIPRLANSIFFNDVTIYDADGEPMDFESPAEVENILCGPASAWSLSPVAQANDSTADEPGL